MIPPQTFSIWEYLKWLRVVEHQLYIRVIKPVTKEPSLVCMTDLDPDKWAFWAERLFMDPRAKVQTWEEWANDSAEKTL